jgi:predicted 3-demethylubiquinone-9 3-methyltransferase (glyoxalase superfamily)
MSPPDKVVPCLWFAGEAEAAARFYVSLLPDSRIHAVTRSPVDTPGGPAGGVLTVAFTLAGRRYLALNGRPDFAFNDGVSFQILCGDQAEVDRLWAALSDGGTELACGWVRDRWGLPWQVTPARLMDLIADPATAGPAMTAMMGMVKIDLAGIEAAVRPPAA